MDIKEFDFEHRIEKVMPMLEEKQLYGTMSLIMDLKKIVGNSVEIRNAAIDEFSEALKKELRNYDFWKFDVVTQYGVQETNVPRDWIVDEIARELKGGAEC